MATINGTAGGETLTATAALDILDGRQGNDVLNAGGFAGVVAHGGADVDTLRANYSASTTAVTMTAGGTSPIEIAGYPAPGGTSFVGSGIAGDAGGRTVTYTITDPSAFTSLWWGPVVGAAMDGNIDPAEVMTNVVISGGGTIATWTGQTTVSTTSGIQQIFVRFVATIQNGTGSWQLDDNVILAAGGPTAFAALNGGTFRLNYAFTASTTLNGTYTAFNALYTSLPTTGMNARTSVNGMFAYTDASVGGTIQNGSGTLVTYDHVEKFDITGGTVGDTLAGGALDDILNGLGGNDSLTGNGGNDTLDGGTGADTMSGGMGDDIYVVDNGADSVVEGANAGTDTVRTTLASYALSGNLENLDYIGAGNFTGTGHGGANRIDAAGTSGNHVLNGLGGADALRGGSGNDRLDGGTGVDVMQGGGGNDSYVVDDALDLVMELAGAGTDTVESSVSYTLSDNVEKLILTGSAAINGRGNALANTLTGNSGANILSGLAGDDYYVVDNRGDEVIEADGQGNDTVESSVSFTLEGQAIENLIMTGSAVQGAGNELDNIIIGNAGLNKIDGGGGNDKLYGGAGKDRLTGGTGADGFYLSHSGTDADKIVDFVAADDTIFVDTSVFGGIADGVLNPNAFRLGTAAQDADDRILYDQTMGYIYYDADGNGAGAAVVIGAVVGGTVLTSADFWGFNGGNLSGLRGGVDLRVSDPGPMVTYNGDNGPNSYTGTDFADVIYGNGGNDTLNGGGGIDTIWGGDGDDQLHGDASADVLAGGAGNDLLDGGTGNDAAFYDDATDSVTIDLSSSGPQVTGGSGTDTLVSIENLGGSSFGDTLTGNGLANVLVGADGNDLIHGLGGIDTLIGGTGNDFLYGDESTDYLIGGDGDDLLDGGTGNDLAYYDDAVAAVFVSLSASGVQLTGGAGNDTLVSIENLRGSSFGDTLTGNGLANVLVGGDGNDLIHGLGGIDTLIGDTGNDDLYGEDGTDYLTGGDGNDLLDGGGGNDLAYYDDATGSVTVSLSVGGVQLTGGGGNDTLVSIENVRGSSFSDTLTGDGIANTLVGADGDDLIHGLGGIDTLVGDSGNDLLYGDDGTDYLTGGEGNDLIDGGSGNDLAYYDDAVGGVTVSLLLSGAAQATGGAGNDTLVSIENLRGSAFADTLTGNDFGNVLAGGDGDDTLYGLGGVDELHGGFGNDQLFGGDSNDNLIGGDGNDMLNGGTGIDLANYEDAQGGITLDLRVTTAQATGGSGTDTLVSIENIYGSSFDDILTGDGGANTINGGDGSDRLDGGAGIDLLRGGFGDDIYFVDDRNDLVVEIEGEGSDTVYASASYALAANVETLIMTGAAVQGQGNGVANTIIGNEGLNKIDGGAGDDHLYGGAGRDRLTGGDGADRFYFSHSGAAHADKIADFVAADDTICLDTSVFAGIVDGELGANAFRLGTAAQDADDRIIYDQALGYIYYDADGNGAGEAVVIAAVVGGTALTSADFWGFHG